MVARIATRSRSGRPHVNPLWFVVGRRGILLNTADWTLAARNVRADPRVVLLLDVERDPDSRQVLRIHGRATWRPPREVMTAYPRLVSKYYLCPGGIRNSLRHRRQARFFPAYLAQGTRRGGPGWIEVIPERAELLLSPQC